MDAVYVECDRLLPVFCHELVIFRVQNKVNSQAWTAYLQGKRLSPALRRSLTSSGHHQR